MSGDKKVHFSVGVRIRPFLKSEEDRTCCMTIDHNVYLLFYNNS